MTTTAIAPAGTKRALVDIAVPVYNEESDLEPSVVRLHDYLESSFPFDAIITVVDNASTDGTWAIAKRLEEELSGVRALHLERKGRGRALRAAWSKSEADVVTYMDVDLSTDLDALLPLVAPLLSGHSDLSIGSRLARGSQVVRGPKREVISRAYNALLRLLLRNRFTDAQCGFKAVRADRIPLLLPLVADEEWFFDTELLVVAERNGLRIHEVPVDWSDDPDSRVRIVQTALADLRGVGRLLREFAGGGGRIDGLGLRRRRNAAVEAARFAGVGLFSTLVYLGLFLGLRPTLGVYLSNLSALALCAGGNLAAHYRITFGRRARASRRALFAGLWMSFLTSLAFTTGCLALLVALGSRSVMLEGVGVLLGNVLAAFVRFVIFRAVLFRDHLRASSGIASTPARTGTPVGSQAGVGR